MFFRLSGRRGRSLRRRSVFLARLAVAVSIAATGPAELVVLRETVGLYPASVGAIAAPADKLFHREREGAPGGIVPGEPLFALERLEVGEPTILEALQPHAAAARHLGHLLEREDHHLAVLADRSGKLAFDVGERARRVRRLDVEHLLALAGIGEALVLGDHKAAALRATDQELAPAPVT